LRRPFDRLRSQFERFATAGILQELVLKLTPEHVHQPELFKLFANALATLDDLEKNTDAQFIEFLATFVTKFLQIQGVQPQFNKCLQCEKPLQAFGDGDTFIFHHEQSGWSCSGCRGGLPRTGGSHENAFGYGVRSRSTTGHMAAELGGWSNSTDRREPTHGGPNEGFMRGAQPLRSDSKQSVFATQAPLSFIELLRWHQLVSHSIRFPFEVSDETLLLDPDASRRLLKLVFDLLVFHVPGADRTQLNSLKLLGLEAFWPNQKESHQKEFDRAPTHTPSTRE
jgi:hypothetical protein